MMTEPEDLEEDLFADLYALYACQYSECTITIRDLVMTAMMLLHRVL